jgi:hypothetical protein
MPVNKFLKKKDILAMLHDISADEMEDENDASFATTETPDPFGSETDDGDDKTFGSGVQASMAYCVCCGMICCRHSFS